MKSSQHQLFIRLRRPKPGDSPHLYQWINNAELVVMNSPYRPIPQVEHDHWFSRLNTDSTCSFFMIEEVQNGLVLGSCQLTNIHAVHKTAELQIRIGRLDYQNRGLGTQAVRLLAHYGFYELGLHRIALHVFSSNLRAISVYKKIGFQQEGLLREAVLIEGRRTDVLIFSLLRDEFCI